MNTPISTFRLTDVDRAKLIECQRLIHNAERRNCSARRFTQTDCVRLAIQHLVDDLRYGVYTPPAEIDRPTPIDQAAARPNMQRKKARRSR